MTLPPNQDWISTHDRMPYDGALCWATVGWQHYAGETTVGLLWYKDGHWYDVFISAETGQPAYLKLPHDENWQFAATHWMSVSNHMPEAPAPYIFRDGTMFDQEPTAEELAEH